MENNQNLPVKTNDTMVARAEDVVDTSDASAQQEVMRYVKTESRQDKINILNALDKADDKIINNVDKILEVAGVYAETHYSQKKQKQVCRVLVITTEGKSYATGSFVFMNSLKRIIDVMGSPLEEPIKIKILHRSMEKGDALTAKVVE